jgi:hypothetical protein
MSTFPTLKTGAVMQYPAERNRQFSNQVIRFLDGSEQRFREFAQPLHRWVIKLDAIDESEMNQLREFFRIQDGAFGEFSFTDPWDGTVYISCSLETDAMVEKLVGEGRGQTSLVVKENR